MELRRVPVGRESGNQVKQEIRLFLEQLWGSLFHCLLEGCRWKNRFRRGEMPAKKKTDGLTLRVSPWNTIPGLCVTPMHVVDRIGVVVFIVPAEGGKAHAHVKPGYHHARNVASNVTEHGIRYHRDVIQIPGADGIRTLWLSFH